MQFPKDHFWHPEEYQLEWCYFWGKLETGQFFHFAEYHFKFAKTKSETIHYSLDGEFKDEIIDWNGDIYSQSGYTRNRFSFQTPELGLTFIPECRPVVHKIKSEVRNYYSVPYLAGEGHFKGKEIKAIGWFDHEFSNSSSWENVPNWDWVSIQLNTGTYITVGDYPLERYCDVAINDKTISSDFALEGNELSIFDFGMKLKLQPLRDEIIFEPRFGRRYSEQPNDILFNDKVIGFGVRERTYSKEKENG